MDHHEKYERFKKGAAGRIKDYVRDRVEERKQRIRLEELYKKCHRVGNITLPIPNLFAIDFLDKKIGGLENIEIEERSHLGAIVWICENQSATDAERISAMSQEEIDAAIRKRMTRISAEQQMDYLKCVHEILLAIKKNFMEAQGDLIKQTITILDSSQDLQSSLSD